MRDKKKVCVVRLNTSQLPFRPMSASVPHVVPQCERMTRVPSPHKWVSNVAIGPHRAMPPVDACPNPATPPAAGPAPAPAAGATPPPAAAGPPPTRPPAAAPPPARAAASKTSLTARARSLVAARPRRSAAASSRRPLTLVRVQWNPRKKRNVHAAAPHPHPAHDRIFPSTWRSAT